MTQGRERPILYSGEMVRALLSGRKTQTRRPVTVPRWKANGRPVRDVPFSPYYEETDGVLYAMDQYGDYHESEEWGPYRAGDVAWVRETWGVGNWNPIDRVDIAITYRADGAAGWLGPRCPLSREEIDAFAERWGRPSWKRSKWKPSIHMPRWACRLTHRVLSCRAERLQCITEADAIAEGVEQMDPMHPGAPRSPLWYVSREPLEVCSSARDAFAFRWNVIYGGDERYSWQANPWVWRIESEKAIPA